VTEIAAAPLYLDARLKPETSFDQVVPREHAVLAYVFEGEALFGEQTVSAVRMIQFAPGERLQVRTQQSGVRFMLIAGRPFQEPIAPYGPFVMNTRQEIEQALADLRNGTFVQNDAS
jgi:hypothetical protein